MNKEKNFKNENGEEQLKDKQTAEENKETEAQPSTAESKDDKADEAPKKDEKKDPLEEANAHIEELKDKYLRQVAEFENYKKRTLKEKAELILNGAEKTVTAILPVLDDMERALQNAGDTEEAQAFKDGFELIYKKFVKTLESLGVKKIETEGQDFNTDFHEAIAMVPGLGDDKKGKVIDCVQTGYTLNDKVIRHAKVAVGQ